jgi:hypothetical protein
MPYIQPEIRDRFEQGLMTLRVVIEQIGLTEGDLNYLVTRLTNMYLVETGAPNYSRYNSAIGALECAKLELYRRRLTAYEDKKIEENGDVY